MGIVFFHQLIAFDKKRNGNAGYCNLTIGNEDVVLYNQAMHNDDVELNGCSLQELLGVASSASVDRSNIQAANRPLALKSSASEAPSRSIYTANTSLLQKATTSKAPERSLLNASRPSVLNSQQFENN